MIAGCCCLSLCVCVFIHFLALLLFSVVHVSRVSTAHCVFCFMCCYFVSLCARPLHTERASMKHPFRFISFTTLLSSISFHTLLLSFFCHAVCYCHPYQNPSDICWIFPTSYIFRMVFHTSIRTCFKFVKQFT